MFKFFTDRRWYLWSIGGTLLILMATWYQVQLDVRINEWFGEFYDTLQKALTNPNSVSEKELEVLKVNLREILILLQLGLQPMIVKKIYWRLYVNKPRRASSL